MQWNHPTSTTKRAGILISLWLIGMLSACGLLRSDLIPPQPGDILFVDNFQDNRSGWNSVSSERGETQYMNGAYRIWIDQPYTNLWATPKVRFEDVQVDVQAENVAGPDSNVFGIICRANQEESSYYFLVISSDGYYGIGKVKGQQQSMLNSPVMLPHPAIHQGRGTNQIRADCVGDRLVLFVNGQKLGEARDGEFMAGEIGLTAGTFDQPGVDIRFTDFRVSQPDG